MNSPPHRKSFRETQFELREEAILDATNRLLAERGFEAMAMDDIATMVGVAKGSLYKHFESKEVLAAAVMTRLLRQTSDALSALGPSMSAFDKLCALLRWTLMQRIAGGVPHLPSTSRTLQASLLGNRDYMNELMALTDRIGELIVHAKADGDLNPALANELLLYTLYARSCDPTLDFLKAAGTMRDDEIVDQMTLACFRGLETAR